MEEKKKGENFVEVTVNTTAGPYPAEGTERVPVHQKVSIILKKAAERLGITDTNGWIATATVDGNSKTLTINASYVENGVAESVDIDYGPVAGGGGGCTN